MDAPTAARKSRTIERKIKGVQEPPASEAAGLLTDGGEIPGAATGHVPAQGSQGVGVL